MNHLLRAAYCINDQLLEGGEVGMCPKNVSQWTPWWDVSDFRHYISSKMDAQHGEDIMQFYRKYINPSHTADEVTTFFPQGARFAVSRETIHRRPKADYEALLATLSRDDDSYAGYYMEWLWSELFVGHQQHCAIPAKLSPVSHADAMRALIQRFPGSVERHLSGRVLTESSTSPSSSGCTCEGVSGGVSGGISGGVSDGISGAISGSVSGSISGGISAGVSAAISGGVSGSVSGDISGGLSGEISGSGCTCGGVSGDIPSGVSGDISGGISGGILDDDSTTTTTSTISSADGTRVA